MTAGLDWTADYGAFTYHGGAIEVARRLAPGAPEPWIDLSTETQSACLSPSQS